MIEALTPQVLSAGLFLVIALSSALSALASLLVLSLYRRRVVRAMAATAGEFGATPAPSAAVGGSSPLRPPQGAAFDAAERYRRALRAPWHAAVRDAAAGAAFALLMSAAVGFAFPLMSTPLRLALFAWGYAWPVVLALILTGPGGPRVAASAVAAYFLPLLGFTIAAFTTAAPSPLPGLDVSALRATITPVDVARAWLISNAAPTALLLLFLGRRIRAIGPLFLALVTTMTTGCVVSWLALFTVDGAELVVRIAVASRIPVPWLLALALVLALLSFAAVGWGLLRQVRRAWLRKTVNDWSLSRDALWLFFASTYAMWFAMAAPAWALVPLFAFVAYKLAGAALLAALPPAPGAARGLTFLRVFSLGRRSDRLFDALTRHWRHVGPIQLITGPDVASSTVQPHQLLDFLAGRLATHFIGDARSLAQRLKERDTEPDRDGRYRINNFFCHADTWQAVLARLVGEGDVVLMDLRSFSAGNLGCVHELRYLVNFVPLQRCLLLIDDSTDQAFLRSTLEDAWHGLDPRSPNRTASPGAVPLHRFGAGRKGLRQLLRRLCEAN